MEDKIPRDNKVAVRVGDLAHACKVAGRCLRWDEDAKCLCDKLEEKDG